MSFCGNALGRAILAWFFLRDCVLYVRARGKKDSTVPAKDRFQRPFKGLFGGDFDFGRQDPKTATADSEGLMSPIELNWPISASILNPVLNPYIQPYLSPGVNHKGNPEETGDLPPNHEPRKAAARD
ncbi:hypothetical protein DFS34DRAFT_592864 [Phlyctochytrium arcticum]|nr:hypothetical protein DFS34DRAFT_592864 [Phlyctochytrium arcticum]